MREGEAYYFRKRKRREKEDESFLGEVNINFISLAI